MHKLSPALFALLLAGCQMAPPHVRPDLPTAPAYPANEEAAGDAAGAPAVSIGWRDYFADPRLSLLVDRALEKNRDLIIAAARIEEARGLYRIQRADRLPTVAAAGSMTAEELPGTGAEDRYAIGVSTTAFELDFWGRVRNLSDAARAQYLATIEAREAFRLSLIRDVATSYFAMLEARERIALASATVTSRQEGLRIAKLRLNAGITSALDYRQAEALLTQAQTELAALQLLQERSRNFLTVLVGGTIPADLPDPLPLDRQIAGPHLAAGLPSDLLTNRPDIRAAEEQLRAARANVGAARAAFFPTISLTGLFGFASGDLDNLLGKDGMSWNFGPTISLPLFDGGRRDGNLTVAEARQDQAIAAYEASIQNGFREVADGLAGRRWLASQLSAQHVAVEAQREIARLARLRYREGVANYLEVLDAERNLFQAEQVLIQLHAAELDNLVSLYVALGGGALRDTAPPQPAGS